MESESLLRLLISNLPLAIASTALVISLVALALLVRQRNRSDTSHETLKLRVDSLWRDMDEFRVDYFNRPGNGQSRTEQGTEREQFITEKQAYEQIWPQVWSLHDKLGMFLRSVEAGEPAGELRMEARNAALDARSAMNRMRPFCHGDVDNLVTRVIDNDIKAHLAACQYLDLLKETATANSGHERNIQRDKFRMLYDSEARELINQLVSTVRTRMIRHKAD